MRGYNDHSQPNDECQKANTATGKELNCFSIRLEYVKYELNTITQMGQQILYLHLRVFYFMLTTQ